MSSLPAPSTELNVRSHVVARKVQAAHDSVAVLLVVPTLDVGAAGAGAVELVRILASAGFRTIVVSRAGRLVAGSVAAQPAARRECTEHAWNGSPALQWEVG